MLNVPTLWTVFVINFLALGLVWAYVTRSYPKFEAAPFWTAAVYYVLLPMLREIARLKAESAAKALAEKPPDHPVP